MSAPTLDLTGYDDMITAKDIRAIFKVSKPQAYLIMEQAGAIRAGRCVRLPKCKLIAYIESSQYARPTEGGNYERAE